MNKKLIFLPIIIIVLLLSACAPNELKDSVYVPNLYPNANNNGNVGKTGSQWNNGYFKNLYVNGQPVSTSASSSSGLTNPLTADLDFAKYKAVAMAADNGATLPASPVVGQWFLHTPTGRKILYQYNGTAWSPIISLGDMTIYVSTTGTNDLAHGTGTGVNAFLTVQYAINAIPPLFGGNVTINVGAGTFSENVTIQGKKPTDNYGISIYGTLTKHDDLTMDGNGVKGATVTQSSVHRTGLTSSHYQNQLFLFTSGSNNGLYRIIDNNNTTDITLVGPTLTAQPVTNDTGTVYTWGATLTSITAINDQKFVTVYDMAFSGSSYVRVYAAVNFYRCSFSYLELDNYSQSAVVYSLVNYGASAVVADVFSFLSLSSSKVTCQGTGGYGVVIRGGSSIVSSASIISDTTAIGVWILSSTGTFWTPDVYNIIRNNGIYGLAASSGGEGSYASYISYSANGTNQYAEATSYSYISN